MVGNCGEVGLHGIALASEMVVDKELDLETVSAGARLGRKRCW